MTTAYTNEDTLPAPHVPTTADGSLDGLMDARGRSVGALSADFRRTVLMLSRRLRSEKVREEVTDAQMSVLVNLIRNGSKSPSELARSEHVKAPSMTRMIDSLESQGLVSRGSNARDGRRCIVELSPGGREFVHRTRRLRQMWLVGRLGVLRDDELQTLEAAIPLMQRILATEASAPAAPAAPATLASPAPHAESQH
ncbi:MarR family transcriptional regulator [Micrococcales bacterium 31B]|nr:MarR family transcriptional regulator [Micrococcales bacterium 31B]